MTWLVNSVVHIWGSRDYESGDNSRNNALVALLVFGDGWHNNHHAFEVSVWVRAKEEKPLDSVRADSFAL
jgi:fatty-acid desaturase